MLQAYIKKIILFTLIVLVGLFIGFKYLNYSKSDRVMNASNASKTSNVSNISNKSNTSTSNNMDLKKPQMLASATNESKNIESSNEAKAPFEEGKHYKRLPAKITSNKEVQQFIAEDPNKIQVIEFFSYACYWCQRLHPIVNQWEAKKPNDVVFYRFPVVFHAGWDKLAKAYYMVQQLGRAEELDKAFFEAIHQKNLNLTDEKLLKEFFIRHGVTEEKFKELYDSFSVTRALSRGNELSNAFQIALSPVFIVNTPSGSYLLTAAMAGTEQGVVDVLNYIVSKKNE